MTMIFDSTGRINRNATFGAGIFPARPKTGEPTAADVAWNDGYCLGREGVAARPCFGFEDERFVSWHAGYDQGLAEYEEELADREDARECDWLEAQDVRDAEAALRELDPYFDIEDAELNEGRITRKPIFFA